MQSSPCLEICKQNFRNLLLSHILPLQENFNKTNDKAQIVSQYSTTKPLTGALHFVATMTFQF